jgi:hypothetical protein
MSTGYPIANAPTAAQWFQQNIARAVAEGRGKRGDTNPPVGAFVFWNSRPGYPEGHVAIAVGGGGLVISTEERTYTTIHRMSIQDRNSNPTYGNVYLGWILP